MDDDKGLELSLGLACGGSSSTSKDRSGNSADGKTDPDERTIKILNDFKNFLSAVPQSFPRSDAVKPKENFFSNLQQSGNGENVSGDEPGVGDKRKSTFDEMNDQKKQETDSRNSGIQDKDKTSHISITTDEGSTADNEDVAESEAEGSTSRLASHQDDGSRTPAGSGSSSQAPKELCGKPNNNAPFSVQLMNNMNIPYSITIKEPPSASAPSTPSYSLPGMMQGITSTNGERPRLHATALGSLPMSFGYSPVQIPVLDSKDNTWRMVTQPQSIPATYAGRSISTSVPMQAINSSSESVRLDVHPSEQPKGQPQLVAEEGSSSQIEGDAKGRGSSFPSEYPAIRPGIASEMNFGGSGSFPNLPWVSTTSPGPNGKTISGVTYKYNATQIKIVCACHGIHMSPEEFVRHATEEEQSPVTTPNLTSIRNTNPATSAKS